MTKRLFWLALVLYVVTQGLQLWSDPDPSMVDLEVSFTPARAERVLDIWEESETNHPLLNLLLDFLFIAGYVGLIWTSIRWAMETPGTWLSRHGGTLQRLAVVAGLVDGLENLLLLVLVVGGWQPPSGLLVAAAGCAAVAKFALLAAVLIAFCVVDPVKSWLIDLQSALRLCRANVIVLLVGWAFLLLVPQGRDVVHTLGEPPLSDKWLPIFWFFVAVLFWALSIWYWARVILRFDWGGPPAGRSGHAAGLRKYVPRILGLSALLAVAAAFASAAGASADERTQAGHWRLFAISCAVALLYFVYVFLRQSTGGSISYEKLKDLGPPTRLAIGLLAFVTVSLFVTFSINPGLGVMLGSGAVLLLAGSAWVAFGTLLVYLGQRYEVPLLTLIVTSLVVFSFWNDNHAVRKLADKADPGRPAAVGVEEHFGRWLAERARHEGSELAASSPEAPYPVVVVATEGGGIRAAYWTATVLGRLQDKYEEERSAGRLTASGTFADHVYAISGVSGGSLGAAVFAALVREQSDDPDLDCDAAKEVTSESGEVLRRRGPIETCAHQMLREDFLSPTVAALLYPDLVQRFLPIPIAHFDRGRALEVSWQEAWNGLNLSAERFGGKKTGAFNELWRGADASGRDNSYRVPLLFLNTTHVETGKRVLISPVPVEDSEFLDVVDFYDKIGAEIRLSTAAHSSARFTFVSPAGTVRDAKGDVWGHVVDGGYFENSGATAALEILRAMRAGAGEDRWRTLRPIVLMISNDPGLGPRDSAEDVEPRTFLKEALSPIVALLRTRGARGSYSKEALETEVGQLCAITCAPRPEGAREEAAPSDRCEPRETCYGLFHEVDLQGVEGVPLGWALSTKARTLMDGKIEAEADEVLQLLN